MDSLEELAKRKKELELRRDIARLERMNRWAKIASDLKIDWSLIWVVPFTLAGAFFIVAGVHDGYVPIFIVGVLLLILVTPRLIKIVRSIASR